MVCVEPLQSQVGVALGEEVSCVARAPGIVWTHLGCPWAWEESLVKLAILNDDGEHLLGKLMSPIDPAMNGQPLES